MSFTLAIVGRPNVGKSTLFNRLVGKRLALVDDQPGVTRDLREGEARLADLRFTVIDTAGLEDATDNSLQGRMRRLTERAVDMADVCLFMIDARTGITPTDEMFAEILRKRSAHVILAANKATDLAILRAKGKGFTPLPVDTSAQAAPLGGKVRVFSHPDRHFYVLSEGIISRKYLDSARREGPRRMIAITADFAKGSSGAPVFNEYGAVVASVNNTQSTYYSVKNGVKDNLQMVFKNTVSMEHLRELIKAE